MRISRGQEEEKRKWKRKRCVYMMEIVEGWSKVKNSINPTKKRGAPTLNGGVKVRVHRHWRHLEKPNLLSDCKHDESLYSFF